LSNYYKNKDKIQNFIENRLSRQLKRDQKNLKILSEGDLQSCVYFHLRKFFDRNKIANWHIINKLSMGERTENKKFPDIAIVYSKEKGKRVYLSFLIELKEDYPHFSRRKTKIDLKKLITFIKKHKRHLEQTYFIYSVLDKNYKPKEIDQKISDMIPSTLLNYIIPITINVIGQKMYPRELESFERKVKKLRKFRN